MSYTWAEPFAGAAAVALYLVGGPGLRPPVAFMGGKRRYAQAITEAMGVEGRPSRVLLSDAGPWGWVWPLLLAPASAAEVADVLRSWKDEHPRDLWKRLAAQPPAEDLHERAAQWLWLQARSASGVPIWWDGWRHVAPNGRGGVSSPHYNTGQAVRDGWTEEERARGCRIQAPEESGAWLIDDTRGAGPRAICQVGNRDPRPCGHGGGMIHTGNLADRIEAVAQAFAGVEVEVHHGEARDVLPQPGEVEGRVWPARVFGRTYTFLDPPYQGATGYGWDCPRSEVLVLARRWAGAGAVVAVSEAEPLPLDGWHHVELTREGGKPEWLTLSRPPVRVPARQLGLFDGAGAP